MASSLKVSTGDLRSAAKEYQRDRNHNAKWARGFAAAPGKQCVHNDGLANDACTECAVRPQHRDEDRYVGNSPPVLTALTIRDSRMGRHFSDLKHKWNNKSTGQKTTVARKIFRNEVLDTGISSSDSSAGEEDSREASAAPVPDAEIMYSYDATHGPGRGTDVLSHAVTKAVQRYENKVTEKLVKEYDFVDAGKDVGDGYAADADEDDFEMIHHANLE
jgi:hypothetical protein